MPWTRDDMTARAVMSSRVRAARELKDGFYVNLGIGIPTLVANHIPPGVQVTLQSENGMLGMGPYPFEGEEDPDLVNAGKMTISELDSSSYFNSAESFAMIRGGHIDLSVLGAMDLVAGVKRVIVVMEHCEKSGRSKLVHECTLPLTGKGVVDLLITDLGVFDINRGRGAVRLLELAPGVTLDHVRASTEADFVTDLA